MKADLGKLLPADAAREVLLWAAEHTDLIDVHAREDLLGQVSPLFREDPSAALKVWAELVGSRRWAADFADAMIAREVRFGRDSMAEVEAGAREHAAATEAALLRLVPDPVRVAPVATNVVPLVSPQVDPLRLAEMKQRHPAGKFALVNGGGPGDVA